MTEDAVTLEATREDARKARKTVFLLSGTFFLIFMGAGAQQLYIAPYLEGCTGWSGLMRGLVVATIYASMMVFRVGNVYLLRRWSYWRLTAVGSLTYLLFTLAMLATFWVKSYALLLAAAALWGWGGAAMWTGTTMQILAATDVGKRHGIATGVLLAATHGGWLVGTVVLGHVYATREPYVLYIVAASITMIGSTMAWLQPRDEGAMPPMPALSDLWEIARRAKVRIAAFLQVASALSFGFMLGGFGDHIKAQHGTEYIWVAAALYPAVRLILSFSGGALADRVGHGFILAGGFFVAAAGMLVAGHGQSVGSAAIAALALGTLSGAVPVVATAMVGESADRQRRPLAYGALFAWRDIGVVVAAVWSKVLMRGTLDFGATFASFAYVFVLCGLVALALERYAKERW